MWCISLAMVDLENLDATEIVAFHARTRVKEVLQNYAFDPGSCNAR
jgi:hypothetical protein